jgi:predicted acetyltransferase
VSDVEIRPLRPDEVEQFASQGTYSFAGRSLQPGDADFLNRIQLERHILVAVEDGQIVSQALIYPFAIWIDGARYETGGLANVSTVPEKSRRGYAARLVRATLAWMKDELGFTLSTLFPTMYPLYAGLGWAHAEDAAHFQGPPAAFRPSPLLPSDSNGRVVRRLATLADRELLEPLYRDFAAPRSGYLDRPSWLWEDRILRSNEARPAPWLGLWIGSDGKVGGYVLYYLRTEPTRSLRIRELIAIQPEAYHGLLSFVATHHLWESVQFDAGRDVPWVTLVANPHLLETTVRYNHQFMLRIVDLPATLALVPAPADAPPVNLRVVDEAAPWNDGVWRIAATAGPAGRAWICERTAGSAAAATADIATLSALHAGMLPLRQAIDTGLLRAEPSTLPTLTALFRRSYPPHGKDYF